MLLVFVTPLENILILLSTESSCFSPKLERWLQKKPKTQIDYGSAIYCMQ